MRSLEEIKTHTKDAIVDVYVRTDPNPVYGDIDNVKMQREACRVASVMGGYDYLFFHGHDTFPPANVIDVLMGHGKDVVSGVYWHRPKKHDHVHALSAVAWYEGTDTKAKDMLLMDDSVGLVPIDGFGLDCALIKTSVLQGIGWDFDERDDDHPWCDLARSKGVRLYIDTSVQCRHHQTPNTYSERGKAFYGVGVVSPE